MISPKTLPFFQKIRIIMKNYMMLFVQKNLFKIQILNK
jgi:hypothetical protein